VDIVKNHAECDFATFKGCIAFYLKMLSEKDYKKRIKKPAMASLIQKGCNHFIMRSCEESGLYRIDGYVLHKKEIG